MVDKTTALPKIDINSWVDNYGDMLYSYALGRVEQPMVAQDLVQDTFVAALQAQHSFAGNSTEKTWLVGILKHKILDYYRKKYRGIEDQLEFNDAIEPKFDASGHYIEPSRDWGKNPEKAISNTEFVEVLGNCLEKLPENQKVVFKLREMEDLDCDEICNIVGVTPTNLGVLLFRARQRLRKCLEINWFAREEN